MPLCKFCWWLRPFTVSPQGESLICIVCLENISTAPFPGLSNTQCVSVNVCVWERKGKGGERGGGLRNISCRDSSAVQPWETILTTLWIINHHQNLICPSYFVAMNMCDESFGDPQSCYMLKHLKQCTPAHPPLCSISFLDMSESSFLWKCDNTHATWWHGRSLD